MSAMHTPATHTPATHTSATHTSAMHTLAGCKSSPGLRGWVPGNELAEEQRAVLTVTLKCEASGPEESRLRVEVFLGVAPRPQAEVQKNFKGAQGLAGSLVSGEQDGATCRARVSEARTFKAAVFNVLGAPGSPLSVTPPCP